MILGRPIIQRERLTDEQRALAEEFVPVANTYAKIFAFRYGFDEEEMRSAAFEALVSHAGRIQKEQNGDVFIRQKIKFGLVDYIRKQARRNAITGPILEYEESEAKAEPYDDQIERILARCDPRTRKILKLHYLEGYTDGEIAKLMKLSCSRVYQKRVDGLQWLRSLPQIKEII